MKGEKGMKGKKGVKGVKGGRVVRARRPRYVIALLDIKHEVLEEHEEI